MKKPGTKSGAGKNDQGFTLVELIIIIVILGIIAVIAIPKYIDVKADAQQAAVDGVTGALAAASATNKALRSAFGTDTGFAATSCNGITTGLDGGLPSGYSVSTTAITNGATATCTVTGPGTKTANFVGHGIT